MPSLVSRFHFNAPEQHLQPMNKKGEKVFFFPSVKKKQQICDLT